MSNLLTASVVRKALKVRFQKAELEGRPFEEVLARDFHHDLGGGTGKDYRMPQVCNVMRQEYKEGIDKILDKPDNAKMQSTTLKIRYRIPR